jgi:hypothetical protein
LFAGKVTLVKRLMFFFLIVWLSFMSGGANAHTTTNPEHLAVHALELVSQDRLEHKPQAEVVIQAPTTQDADCTDCCNQVHCEKCHATYLLTPHSSIFNTNRLNTAPRFHLISVSSAVTANIERPKWSYTTPAVVSLLS